MPALINRIPEHSSTGALWWHDAARLLIISLLGVVLSIRPLHAAEPDILQSALQRTSDGLYLSVRLDLKPSPTVEDTLRKGVPLYFVWQTEVMRERWYWTDKRLAQTTRIWRLAYQPLTRRWRLSLSNDAVQSAAGNGLQYALHQNFENLSDALANIGRVVNWKLADAWRLRDAEAETVDWSFRLDLGLLPRPFQIGMTNQSDWLIAIQRRLPVPAPPSISSVVPETSSERIADDMNPAR